MIDKTLTSRLQIVKCDAETGNTVLLSGFKFQLLDADGKVVSFDDPYDVNAKVDTFTTDANGQVSMPGKLKSGKPHDGRAPDYDDWDLNCDIFFWDPALNRALEISSMGIRVDAEALDRQLRIAGCDDRRELPFHKMLLAGELPLTIGGGIGQSRLSMLLMGCAHIGEVQSSIWDQETMDTCEKAGIPLL